MQSATQVSCFMVLFCLCFDGGFIEKATEFSVKEDGLFFFGLLFWINVIFHFSCMRKKNKKNQRFIWVDRPKM